MKMGLANNGSPFLIICIVLSIEKTSIINIWNTNTPV